MTNLAIYYDSSVSPDYILASSFEAAIKKYYDYRYTNLLKPLIRDDILPQVKVVENDKIVLKF